MIPLKDKLTAAKTISFGGIFGLGLYGILLPSRFSLENTTNSTWWQSNWFLGGLILLVMGGITWFIIWQLRRRRSREKELEALVTESTQELAFAQAQINALFKDSPLAIGTASFEGVILTANNAMAHMFGYPIDEIIGTEIMTFFPDREQREALIERLLVEKTIRVSNVQLRRRDGSIFHANLTESILTREGKNVIIGVVDDITKQVQTEQAIKKKDEVEAIAAEREYLTRELHDSVTQALYTSSIIAEALPDVWKTHPEDALNSLQDLRRLNEGALAEMRALLLELRPEEITDQPLEELLHQLTEAMSARTKLPITISVVGDCALEKQVQIAFYRIAQEALNNISKHAQAEQAWVSLQCRLDGSGLQIRDNGIGFDPGLESPDHMGLNIMRERAEDIGAALTISSNPDRGTEISVEWGLSIEEQSYEG